MSGRRVIVLFAVALSLGVAVAMRSPADGVDDDALVQPVSRADRPVRAAETAGAGPAAIASPAHEGVKNPTPAASVAAATSAATANTATTATTARTRDTRDTREAAPAATEGDGLPSRHALPPLADLFPVPPPPKVFVPPPPPPPPPPLAPPPSLVLFGRLVDGTRPIALVREREAVVALREGDRTQGWRVERITETGVTLIEDRGGRTHSLAWPAAGGVAGRPAAAVAPSDVPQDQ